MFNYESPLFVNIVLWTIYSLLAVAAVLTLWSVVRSGRLRSKDDSHPLGIPARRIAIGTTLLLAVTMAATWLLASTQPISVNGKTYSDTFWLRTSDMLIGTALVMMAVLLIMMAVVSVRAFLNREKKNDDGHV